MHSNEIQQIKETIVLLACASLGIIPQNSCSLCLMLFRMNCRKFQPFESSAGVKSTQDAF